MVALATREHGITTVFMPVVYARSMELAAVRWYGHAKQPVDVATAGALETGRPAAGSMDHVEDLYASAPHAIWDDVRQTCDNQLTRAVDAPLASHGGI